MKSFLISCEAPPCFGLGLTRNPRQHSLRYFRVLESGQRALQIAHSHTLESGFAQQKE